MTSTPVSTHGHYLLLLSVAGVSQEQFDATAAEVNAAYMEQFGAAGALTAGVLRLGSLVEGGSNAQNAIPWTMVIRYFGPTGSVSWLQNELQGRAEGLKATLQTLTYEVNDVTGRY